MRKKYDSAVVFLYATGNERLLPPDFRKQIPYTTISSWRRTDYSKYMGNEFRHYFDEAFNSAELHYRYENLKKIILAIARSWYILFPTVGPLLKSAKKNAEFRSKVLRAIKCMQKQIGFDKGLELSGISQTLFKYWETESEFKCMDSFTSLCVKRHPHQLELKEINKMKKMLLDPEYSHWPIISIASLALRKKSIVASLDTWYRYSNKWGMQKRTTKKDRKKVGIISSYPNEYLHVDTTYYPLTTGKKAVITVVMDNYSKMILGVHVADALSFEGVRESLRKALEVIAQHPNQHSSFLVADGGKENHNKKIDEFIAKLSGQKITKIRALKDIQFSNSPVEAVHRTLKSRYLKNRKFDTLQAVIKYLEWVVMDYNILRPHYKHRPRTPQEVYFDKPLGFDIKKRVKDAIKKRVRNNKCAKCTQCAWGKCANGK